MPSYKDLMLLPSLKKSVSLGMRVDKVHHVHVFYSTKRLGKDFITLQYLADQQTIYKALEMEGPSNSCKESMNGTYGKFKMSKNSLILR